MSKPSNIDQKYTTVVLRDGGIVDIGIQASDQMMKQWFSQNEK